MGQMSILIVYGTGEYLDPPSEELRALWKRHETPDGRLRFDDYKEELKTMQTQTKFGRVTSPLTGETLFSTTADINALMAAAEKTEDRQGMPGTQSGRSLPGLLRARR